MPERKYAPKYELHSRHITGTQMLAALMCERQARQEKKVLSFQFWKRPPWDAIYRRQAVAATKLCKRLDPAGTGTGLEAVMRFLRSPAGKKVYSLFGDFVVRQVEEVHRQILLEKGM